MQQLEKTLILTDAILKEARRKLCKQRNNPEIPILEGLRNEPNESRLLCPFCLYSSKKNKTSAIIKNDLLHCFACGVTRRIR